MSSGLCGPTFIVVKRSQSVEKTTECASTETERVRSTSVASATEKVQNNSVALETEKVANTSVGLETERVVNNSVGMETDRVTNAHVALETDRVSNASVGSETERISTAEVDTNTQDNGKLRFEMHLDYSAHNTVVHCFCFNMITSLVVCLCRKTSSMFTNRGAQYC